MGEQLQLALSSLSILTDRLVLATPDEDEPVSQKERGKQMLALITLLTLVYGISTIAARVQARHWLRVYSAGEIRRRMFRLVIQGTLRRSVGLISTLTGEDQKRLVQDFLRIGSGKRELNQQVVRRLLQSSYGLSEGDAAKIALDQSRKYLASTRQARLLSLGDVDYVWWTKQDDKVRPTHVLNHGQTFNWLYPPLTTGHPGWEPN